jgi:hypothetical protein
MSKIWVDPELLSKKADQIHQAAGDLIHAGDGLLSEVMRDISASEYSDLQASVRHDGFAAKDLIQNLQRDLSGEADKLAALSRAFRSTDDEAVRFLVGAMGEIRSARSFFGSQQSPDIAGFEPYADSQTRMALTDWVFVYAQIPNRLTRMDVYKTGKIVSNIFGAWTDHKTSQKYYVVNLGNDTVGYIPVEQLSDPIDLSKIPEREGKYGNGGVVEESSLLPPWGQQKWPKSWIDNQWWMSGPQQNLLLGFMDLDVKDKNGNSINFRKTAHQNLCGELSVLASIGYPDLIEGLSIFARKVPHGVSILKDINMGTTIENLADYYRALGWSDTYNSGAMPLPDDIADGLAAGHKYVFGTQLATRTGKLTDSLDNAAH